MRIFLRGLLLACLVGSVLFAAPQSNKQRESIALGSQDLTLGMSEEAAVTKLAESYSLRKLEELPPELRATGVTSEWTVDEKGKSSNGSVGIVSFVSGKLDSVTKPLLPPGGGEVDFGRQLYFAMRDLELEGDSNCTITTHNPEEPDFAIKVAQLRCGKKTLLIDVQKYKANAESVELNEQLDAR